MTIQGLLIQKPTTPVPQCGEIRRFNVLQKTSATGKQWNKIVNMQGDNGTPYEVVSVRKTDYKDDRGNISFNVELETEPSQLPQANPSSFDTRSHRIERQHSQEMALRVLDMLGDMENKDLILSEKQKWIENWTNWFQLDLDHIPQKPQTEEEEEPPF